MHEKLETRPPLLFSLASFLNRHRVRGGYNLLHRLRRAGALDAVVRYELWNGYSIDVPLWRNAWDRQKVLNYSTEEVRALVEESKRLAEPVTYIDCGADIGTICGSVIALSGRISKVIAFEPNRDSFKYLERNVSRWLAAGESHCAAVADFVGRGALASPPHDATDHAKFVVPAEPGDFPVLTIDSLGLEGGGGLLLKIDVEGSEINVVRGARETLARAAGFAVSFEAQKDQVARSGHEPNDVIRFLQSIRPCRYCVVELPGWRLDVERPFFSQISNPWRPGYNIMCRSL